MSTFRFYHTSVALDDGRGLITGGFTLNSTLKSSEIYDPQTGELSLLTEAGCESKLFQDIRWELNYRMVVCSSTGGIPDLLKFFNPQEGEIGCFTHRLEGNIIRKLPALEILNDGRVLIVGGTKLSSELEIFDPDTNQISLLPHSMQAPRYGASIVRMLNGKVLITGGFNNEGTLNTTEIFDPQNNSIEALSSFHYPRYFHRIFTLQSGEHRGKIQMVAGVAESNDKYGRSSYELYDPETNSWEVIKEEQSFGFSFSAIAQNFERTKAFITGGYYEGSNRIQVIEL